MFLMFADDCFTFAKATPKFAQILIKFYINFVAVIRFINAPSVCPTTTNLVYSNITKTTFFVNIT